MSSSLNRVTLIGHLGQDPEVRNLQNGNRLVTLSVATSESWKDDRGERRERTEWHRVTVFNEGLGTLIEKYLVKGSKVLIEGQLRTRKYQDQSGTDRYSTEVVLSAYNGQVLFLDRRKDGNGSNNGSHAEAQPRGGGRPDLDDDIPF